MSDAACRIDAFAPVARDGRETWMQVHGQSFVIDPAGALWWPSEGVLIVADLHLEKGSAFAARGRMLPPYDTASTLARVGGLFRRYRPRAMAVLGDSFHDRRAGERIAQRDVQGLTELVCSCDWMWIAGNHDPVAPAFIQGDWLDDWRHGGLTFRHEPCAGEVQGEIAGHLHPAARVQVRGRLLRRRCVASNGMRAVLPAFGAYTGGLNVLDAAFLPLFPAIPPMAFVLGTQAVFPVTRALLARDA